MKVILLENIAKLGKKYEVKTVADGHAINMLIPRGLVEVATAESMKKLEARKANEEANRKKQDEALAKTLKKIDGKTFEIKMKLNEKGHLFAALHADDVAKLIMDESKVEIPSEYLALEKPIKEAGDHKINLSVSGVQATVNVKVVGE